MGACDGADDSWTVVIKQGHEARTLYEEQLLFCCSWFLKKPECEHHSSLLSQGKACAECLCSPVLGRAEENVHVDLNPNWWLRWRVPLQISSPK